MVTRHGGWLLIGALALGCAAQARAEPSRAERDAIVDGIVRDAWRVHLQQRYSVALAQLERAERLAPARADVQLELGEVLFWLHRIAASRDHFERAALLEPTLAHAYAGIGQTCNLLAAAAWNHPRTSARLLTRAQRAFELTLLLDPKHPGAREGAKRVADARADHHPLTRLQIWIATLLLALSAAATHRLFKKGTVLDSCIAHNLQKNTTNTDNSIARSAAKKGTVLDSCIARKLRAALRPLHELRAPLLLFAATRGLVLAAIAVAPALLAEAPSHPPQLLRHGRFVLDVVAGRWDSNLYVLVGDMGYTIAPPGTPDVWSGVGQFPLLPVLYRWLAYLFDDKHIAALVLPNASLLLASVLLYAAFLRDHGPRIALGATAVLLLHPGSLYGSVLYTEPLALLGLAGVYFCLQRQAYLEAGLWGVFAGLARINSLAIVPWLLLHALHARGRERLVRAWPVLAPVLGVGLFMLYLQLELGDPLAYFHELRAARFANKGTFVGARELLDALRHVFVPGPPRGGPLPALLLSLACLAVYVSVLIAQLRARDFGPALFIASGIALGMLSSLCAQPRYLWLLFPAAPFIARAADRPGWRFFLPIVAAIVLSVAAIAFSRWYYVT